MKRRWLTSLRILLGLFFAAGGAMKGSAVQEFSSVISAFDLLPEEWSLFTAVAIIAGEMFFGTLLMFGIALRRTGAVLIAAILIFTFAAASALMRGIETSCGCFGTSSEETIGAGTLIRNGIILLLLVIVTAARPHEPQK